MTNNSGLKADKALAARLFDELLSLSRDDPGVTRDAYGEGEEKAHRLMRQVSGELDLRTEVDAAGNLFLSFDGADSTLPPWIVGSHLDSVPHGGNYDGAAGVIGGLSALSAIKKAGVIPRRPIRVVIIRAEESTWFPESYIGSRAAFGLLPPSALDVRRADTGRTLREHMLELGLRPDLVATGTAALSAGFVHGFIELHIEQGPNLETEEIPIGLVTGIAGSFRYRNARCRGTYGHSGAVARKYRQDAVFAVSDLIVALDRFWAKLEAGGEPATITVGELSTDPAVHAFSKVPGEVSFCLDVRSINTVLLERIHEHLLSCVREIEQNRNVRFDFGSRSGSKSALLSTDLRHRLLRIAQDLGIPFLTLPSGAGHDSAVFANQGVPTAMIFIRNQNGSHNPDEAMRIDDFQAAASMLTNLLLR